MTNAAIFASLPLLITLGDRCDPDACDRCPAESFRRRGDLPCRAWLLRFLACY